MGVSGAPIEETVLREPGLIARSFAALRDVARRPGGLFGVTVVGALVIVAVFAPQIAPYDPAAQDILHRLEGPSWSHLLGTDQLGRDLLSRILHGTRIALGVAIPAVGIALTSGLVVGVVAGYFGGWLDNGLVVMMDALQAFPAVILALALLALLGPSQRNVIIVIGIAFAPGYARVSRALVYSTKQNQYVEAQRALGARHRRIVGLHILPNIRAPLLVLMAMDIPSAVTTEAGLSFLGLGVQPPTPSWGVILADGFQYVRESAWAIICAGAALMVTTLGFTMLGEALRDVFDPRSTPIRRWGRR